MPQSFARRALSRDWFERAVRFGHGAKAAVFGVLGFLTVRAALGARGETPDFAGALEALADQPLDLLFLGLLAMGLLSYGCWRVAYGLADLGDAGGGVTGWARRGTMMAGGLTYAAFAVYAVALMLGARRDPEGVEGTAGMVLGLPLGPWIVGAVALGAALGGLHELFVAASARFRGEFEQVRMSRWERAGVLISGCWGHVARGTIYVVAGFFGLRAAIRYDPDEAAGFAETLEVLGARGWGIPVVVFLGAGLIAFGVYSLLLAVHRHIPDDEDGRPERRLP